MLDNSSIRQNKRTVNSFECADVILSQDIRDCQLSFSSIAIKNYFLSRINRTIINANSSLEKFNYDMHEYYDKSTIFNNIKCCTDEQILSTIKRTTNLCID